MMTNNTNMTIRERINAAINNWDGGVDNIDKIIALAYYLGREDATKDLSDKVNAVFAEQKQRADECRYSRMAMRVQGNVNSVYSPDYAGDMGKTFGDDKTQI